MLHQIIKKEIKCVNFVSRHYIDNIVTRDIIYRVLEGDLFQSKLEV